MLVRAKTLAQKISQKSDHPAFKMGACVYYKNHILSAGFNSSKTHPLVKHYSPYKTLHAEMHAIIRAGLNNVKGTSIVVYRSLKSGQMAMARPCPICLKIMKQYGIMSVTYTTENGWKTEFVNEME
jgi:deoxycytidylate deaminase